MSTPLTTLERMRALSAESASMRWKVVRGVDMMSSSVEGEARTVSPSPHTLLLLQITIRHEIVDRTHFETRHARPRGYLRDLLEHDHEG